MPGSGCIMDFAPTQCLFVPCAGGAPAGCVCGGGWAPGAPAAHKPEPIFYDTPKRSKITETPKCVTRKSAHSETGTERISGTDVCPLPLRPSRPWAAAPGLGLIDSGSLLSLCLLPGFIRLSKCESRAPSIRSTTSINLQHHRPVKKSYSPGANHIAVRHATAA